MCSVFKWSPCISLVSFLLLQITTNTTTATTSKRSHRETAATTKVTETTADGSGNHQETWKEEVDLGVASIENVIETDTIVIETMIRIEIGITTEVRTDVRVVVVDGNESRKIESLGTATGAIAKIAQIGMNGIRSNSS